LAKFWLLLDAPLNNASLFATLERESGVAMAYSDEEVDAIRADHWVAELLKYLAGNATASDAATDFFRDRARDGLRRGVLSVGAAYAQNSPFPLRAGFARRCKPTWQRRGWYFFVHDETASEGCGRFGVGNGTITATSDPCG
jgi:hypothetical protein